MINMNPSLYGGPWAASLPHAGRWIGRLFGQAVAWMREQNSARRSLQQARSLDDRMLEDVGLTRADLRREGYFDFFGR